MSDDNELPSTSEDFTPDFREGQLQIVEVSKFEKCDDGEECDIVELQGPAGEGEAEEEEGGGGANYMQVIDADGKSLVQLDLLNLTLVRCEDGENEYRLVSTASEPDDGGGGDEEYMTDDNTVTCVLQTSDGEEQEVQESYVMIDEDEQDGGYVMMEGGRGPVMYLRPRWHRAAPSPRSPLSPRSPSPRSSPSGSAAAAAAGPVPTALLVAPRARVVPTATQPEKPTTLELLERAKALNKAKSLLEASLLPGRARGRGRPSRAPPSAQALLSSPNFKLYLYSCRGCAFQCNAMRDLTAHRKCCAGSRGAAAEGGRGGVGGAGPGGRSLQCARCLYRGSTHLQLMRHVQDNHVGEEVDEESCGPDVLVCGGCGFESSSRREFRAHLHHHHQVHDALPATTAAAAEHS